jgi:hypothetical protein
MLEAMHIEPVFQCELGFEFEFDGRRCGTAYDATPPPHAWLVLNHFHFFPPQLVAV